MSVKIDGKIFAQKLCDDLKQYVSSLVAKGTLPTIAVVLVGQDPASQVYVRNKIRRCEELGIRSVERYFESDLSQEELVSYIDGLNKRNDVHGILVQLPLPDHISEQAIINAILPEKDVDGFHTTNVGSLSTGSKGMIPCTPLGSLLLLKSQLGDLSGKHAVIIGRSNIVGKPMGMLLLRENCTVTTVHSRTTNIEKICNQADILVAAVSVPHLVKKEWVKPGAVVIDVGINRIDDESGSRLVGDVDYDDVAQSASAITPVPGGVGPMTIACLMQNTVSAAKSMSMYEHS